MHVKDARLDLLDTLIPGLFEAKHCLDIGCNAGRISCQLGFDFNAASVTGVDIDPVLVKQAEHLLAIRSSRRRPGTNGEDMEVDYFPMSAVLKHGYRFETHGEKPLAEQTSASDPPRVQFVAADWVLSDDVAVCGPFDVILALSVIKWIHLEHLDEGLLTFFRKCATALASGGYLVIELQPWESYEKAVRNNHAPHFREALKQLKYRPEAFTDLLREQGLELRTSSEALVRQIYVYRKV